MGCYIWYSEEGTGRGHSPPRPLLAVGRQYELLLHLVQRRCTKCNSPPIDGKCTNRRTGIADLRSLDFTFNRLFMKLFKTKNIDVVKFVTDSEVQISLYYDLTVLKILFAIFVARFNVRVEYFIFSS